MEILDGGLSAARFAEEGKASTANSYNRTGYKVMVELRFEEYFRHWHNVKDYFMTIITDCYPNGLFFVFILRSYLQVREWRSS